MCRLIIGDAAELLASEVGTRSGSEADERRGRVER